MHRPKLVRLACALVLATDASGADVDRGQSLYLHLCAVCHQGQQATTGQAIRAAAGAPERIREAMQNIGAMAPLRSIVTEAMASDIAAWLATVYPPVPRSTGVVEYHHASFDHYFATGIAAEIDALDTGRFPGWSRTGHAFRVHAAAQDGSVPVCRFFSAAFGSRSSHFLSAFSTECANVHVNAAWRFEGEVMQVTPVAADGSCPGGSQPVFRLYNNGANGAPNHRYTVDPSTRFETIGRGWTPEGRGVLGVVFCAVR